MHTIAIAPEILNSHLPDVMILVKVKCTEIVYFILCFLNVWRYVRNIYVKQVSCSIFCGCPRQGCNSTHAQKTHETYTNYSISVCTCLCVCNSSSVQYTCSFEIVE